MFENRETLVIKGVNTDISYFDIGFSDVCKSVGKKIHVNSENHVSLTCRNAAERRFV